LDRVDPDREARALTHPAGPLSDPGTALSTAIVATVAPTVMATRIATCAPMPPVMAPDQARTPGSLASSSSNRATPRSPTGRSSRG
jgi:hypothetical protein